jgi:hypothetical protein
MSGGRQESTDGPEAYGDPARMKLNLIGNDKARFNGRNDPPEATLEPKDASAN